MNLTRVTRIESPKWQFRTRMSIFVLLQNSSSHFTSIMIWAEVRTARSLYLKKLEYEETHLIIEINIWSVLTKIPNYLLLVMDEKPAYEKIGPDVNASQNQKKIFMRIFWVIGLAYTASNIREHIRSYLSYPSFVTRRDLTNGKKSNCDGLIMIRLIFKFTWYFS